MDDLSHLFGAYFYEAWNEHTYVTWVDAVDDFARRAPERVPGAVSELEARLGQICGQLRSFLTTSAAS